MILVKISNDLGNYLPEAVKDDHWYDEGNNGDSIAWSEDWHDSFWLLKDVKNNSIRNMSFNKEGLNRGYYNFNNMESFWVILSFKYS